MGEFGYGGPRARVWVALHGWAGGISLYRVRFEWWVERGAWVNFTAGARYHLGDLGPVPWRVESEYCASMTQVS